MTDAEPNPEPTLEPQLFPVEPVFKSVDDIFREVITLSYPGIPDSKVTIGPIEHLTLYKKICIYGPPGAGKSTFAAGAPRPFVFDSEHGAHSILNIPELRDKVIGVQIRHYAQAQLLMDLFEANQHELCEKTETLIIDTVGSWQRRVLDEQLKRKGPQVFLPQGNDFNENTQRMRRFITFLRDLEKNIVLICHSKTETNQLTGQTFYRPDVTPVLSQNIIEIMDMVGYFYSVEVPLEGSSDTDTVRYLQVWPSDRVIAKNRFILPKVLVNPTFDMIMQAKHESTEES